MKSTGKALIAVVLTILAMGSLWYATSAGYIAIGGSGGGAPIGGGSGSNIPQCDWTTQHYDPGTKSCVANQALASGQGGPAPLIVGETNPLAGPLLSYGAVEVLSSDKAQQLDNISVTKTFSSGSTPIVPGTPVLLHAWAIVVGHVYYDEWYTVTVGQNAVVNHLVANQNGDPTATKFGVMTWYTTGSSTGWMITPAFPLYEMQEAIGDTYVKVDGPGSIGTIRTATLYTPSVGTWTSVAPDFTATSTSFTLRVTATCSDVAVDQGHSMLTVGPNLEWQSRFQVAWVSFNTTAINPDPLVNGGWTPVGSAGQVSGFATYYKIVPELMGSRQDEGQISFDIKVDTTNLGSSKGVGMAVWLDDGQTISTVQTGLAYSSVVYTPYGGVLLYSAAAIGEPFHIVSAAPADPTTFIAFVSH